jgi:hypothetical protein
MLAAEQAPLQTAQWLRDVFLPQLMARVNHDDVRKRLGLYSGERIPDNERNLTDVRNRVSLIVEYELARLSNDILQDNDEQNLFWAYVVANRFPDLEVRKRDGSRGVRIEVKCLQSIAEEKSANFDTLQKDINPRSDYVIVFLWEWCYASSRDFAWDRAPRLHNVFVFHAASLAQLRDCYWLNRPPADLGTGFQGFDLRFGVNCKNGIYAEEEGNYGKLLRIWQTDFQYRPPDTPVLLDTEQEYVRFKEAVIYEGFWNLCEFYLPRLSEVRQVERILNEGVEVGAQSANYGIFVKSRITSTAAQRIARELGLNFVVLMTDKYLCSGYSLEEQGLRQLFGKLKPKRLARQLFHPA